MPPDWFADTTPQALEVYIRVLREMTPGEKIARIFELCEFQRSLQIANVRALYPEADEHEILLRVAARTLTRDQMIKAYNWDPEEHP